MSAENFDLPVMIPWRSAYVPVRIETTEGSVQELATQAFGLLANKGLSKKTTGVDKVAKRMIAKKVGDVPPDPDLDHPEEWDRPVD